jgi:hypothetical protein
MAGLADIARALYGAKDASMGMGQNTLAQMLGTLKQIQNPAASTFQQAGPMLGSGASGLGALLGNPQVLAALAAAGTGAYAGAKARDAIQGYEQRQGQEWLDQQFTNRGTDYNTAVSNRKAAAMPQSQPATPPPPEQVPIAPPPVSPGRGQRMSVPQPTMAEAATMPQAPQQQTPGMLQALGIAAQTPNFQAEAPAPQPSGQSYGYQSVLNSPALSQEAMMPTQQAAPAQKEQSFMQKLGSTLGNVGQSLVSRAPDLIKSFMLHKAMNDNGGVKDRMTGLTFGARPMNQNPAYIAYMNDMQQQNMSRQMAEEQYYAMMNKDLEHQYQMEKSQFDKGLDFEYETITNMQQGIMDMIKDGSLRNIDSNLVAQSMQGDTEAMTQLMDMNPDTKQLIVEQGYQLFNAIMQEENPEKRAQMLEDKTNQTILGFAELGPDANTVYNQDMQTLRSRENNAVDFQLEGIRQAGANSRTGANLGSAAAGRSIQERRLALEEEKFRAEQQRAAAGGGTGEVSLKSITGPDGGRMLAYVDETGRIVGNVSKGTPDAFGLSTTVGSYTADELAQMGMLPTLGAPAQNGGHGMFSGKPVQNNGFTFSDGTQMITD